MLSSSTARNMRISHNTPPNRFVQSPFEPRLLTLLERVGFNALQVPGSVSGLEVLSGNVRTSQSIPPILFVQSPVKPRPLSLFDMAGLNALQVPGIVSRQEMLSNFSYSGGGQGGKAGVTQIKLRRFSWS